MVRVNVDEELTYVADSDTLLQFIKSTGNDFVKYQTDNTESVWGELFLKETLSLLSGQTVYLKIHSGYALFAEIKF